MINLISIQNLYLTTIPFLEMREKIVNSFCGDRHVYLIGLCRI